MTDKKWNEDLRQRMSEYTENPPEGLWEALKAAGAVSAGETGAGAAGAAGSGLFARLFGRWTAPVWWSLAGVAAAVAAVLFLNVPGGSTKGNPADAIIAETPGVVAQAEIPEDINADTPGMVAQADNTGDLSAQNPARVQNTPVLHPTHGKTPGPGANHPRFAPGNPSSAVSSSDAPASVASSDFATSASDVPAESTSDISTAVSTSDIPAESSSDISTAVSSPVISTEAERSGEIPSTSSQDQNSAVSIQEGTIPAQTGSNQAGFDPESISRPLKRDRPLIAANLVGAGMPGGSTVTNTMNYGLRAGNLKMAGMPREATMLSRNRFTETSITRRLDFQLGLMVSFDITRHWGLETGLLYTRLASTASSFSGNITSTSEDKLNYIGIPLHVIYTPVQLRLLSVYFSAGPELEYGIARNWKVYDMIDSAITASDRGTDFLGDFILSGSLNAGVQIHPTRHGAFFIQPGVVFRHVWDTTLESYYTDHPVSFRLSAGYRITF